MRLQWVQMIEAGKQTERIMTQTRETTERELRAYLGVSECALKLDPFNIPEGQVSIKNFGRTPAYKVRQYMGIGIFPYPLTAKLPSAPPNMPQSVTSIYPNGHHINVVPVARPIVPETCTFLGKPECTVYVFGEVVYEDIFGHEWFTHYRFFWGGRDGGRTKKDSKGVLIGLMQPDSDGNYEK